MPIASGPGRPAPFSSASGVWLDSVMSMCSLERGEATVFAVARQVRLRATEIGALAREMLTAETCRGEVHAVLTDAIYLTTRAGELLWLSTNRSFPHRRYVHVPQPLLGVEPGMSFVAYEGVLKVGGLQIDLTRAQMWSPSRVGRGVGLASKELHARFGILLRVVRDSPRWSADCGFLRLVARPHLDGAADAAGAPFLQAMSAAVDRVRVACRRGALSGVLEAGLGLAGLGPGFTPAGDDYLGGLLFALRHLQCPSAGVARWDERLVDDFLAKVRPHTGWVSHTILCDLARGHGPGPLHDLIQGLLSAPGPALADSAGRLCQIGHSSGRDLLAGTLTASWWMDGGKR